MIATSNIRLTELLDSMNDGVYVCDHERKILYWSKAAERITGWLSADVVGRKCSDNVLSHIDKDGRRLCGDEFCPLHRSIRTDKGSVVPMIVFGLNKSGGRVPMAVSVAPVHNDEGEVIGGIETFRDFTETYRNLLRAKTIQTLSMENSLPVDGRISFNVSYLPNDIVGGDFYSIRQLPSGDYAFMLADVMGHGVAAALYTMHLSSLWNSYSHLLANPVAFAENINRELCKIVKDESFATAICGVINPETGTARVTSAAWPPLLIYRSEGETESIELPGWPLGLENSASYEESELQLFAGETLLMFSDGATEIHNADGELLDLEGLQGLLKSMEYPDRPLKIEALQRQLLNYSNSIRLEDDITLLEIRFF